MCVCVYQLEKHLRALRRYFFAEDGLWARGLAKRLFGDGGALVGEGVLRNLPFVLLETLVESGLDSDPFSRRLFLQYVEAKEECGGAGKEEAKQGGKDEGAHGPQAPTGAFSNVSLMSRVEYPLDIIIHAQAHRKYQRVLARHSGKSAP